MPQEISAIDELINTFGKDTVELFLNKVMENASDDNTVSTVDSYLKYVGRHKSSTLNDADKAALISDIRVGLTYPFCTASFLTHYPNIKVITKPEEVKNFDLIIVPGGADINPAYYHEVNKASDFDAERDDIEIPIVEEALRSNKKMLGICRGHQLINIIKGANFIQDLFGYGYKAHRGTHSLEFHNNGVLYNFFNNKPVNSMHHQAIINPRIRIMCTYEGIVEGCESRNIITTQFHPEFMTNTADFFTYLRSWAFNLV